MYYITPSFIRLVEEGVGVRMLPKCAGEGVLHRSVGVISKPSSCCADLVVPAGAGEYEGVGPLYAAGSTQLS